MKSQNIIPAYITGYTVKRILSHSFTTRGQTRNANNQRHTLATTQRKEQVELKKTAVKGTKCS